MKNIDVVRRINPSVVNNDGSVKSFAKQLKEYKRGQFETNKFMVVSPSINTLSDIGCPKVPIVMSISTLKKLQGKHGLSYGLIKKIPFLLNENITLAFDSPNREDSKVIFVPTEDHPTLMVAINFGKYVYSDNVLEINSVHNRENLEKLVNKAYKNNKTFYFTNKTKKWINAIGLQLPEPLSTFINPITENDKGIKKVCRIENSVKVPMINGEIRELPTSRESLKSRISHASQTSKNSNMNPTKSRSLYNKGNERG